MRVTYSAPNRAHHAAYARALLEAGCLHTFVTGISRFSPRFNAKEFGRRIRRADQLQNLYLESLTVGAPSFISEELAYWSKIWLDWCSTGPASESELFLFYNGAGLRTSRRVRRTGVRCVVEAVNSHVLVQEALLVEESKRIGTEPPRFHRREVRRRLAEYENADAILCPSHFVKKSFASQGFPKENIFVVPYGFYPPAIFEKAAPKGDVFRVLYVGQIHFRKGLRYLVQAFERLRVPKKELLLVGPRTQDTGLADLALPGNVRFCGVARGEELALLYQSATVFVQPSIEEGLSLVLAEALSYGLPVIATENTGARDLFTDGVEGFIVPIRDPDVIADKLELLAGKNELRRGMGEQAGKRARAIGGWEESGKLLVQTLRTICGRG